MKKILTLLIITTFFFACNSDENNETDNLPNDTTEIVKTDTQNDTTEILITPEEAEQQANEILQKTEDINNQLDSILND
jgi:thioredoxin-related protein